MAGLAGTGDKKIGEKSLSLSMGKHWEVVDIAQLSPSNSPSTAQPILAEQYSTRQYSTVQYSTLLYSTVYYSTVRYSVVHYSTVQHSTLTKPTCLHVIYIWHCHTELEENNSDTELEGNVRPTSYTSSLVTWS